MRRMGKEHCEDEDDDEVEVALRRIRIGTRLRSRPPSNLSPYSLLLFQASASADPDEVRCVYWDLSLMNGTGDWSTTGCHLHGVNSGRYVCHCDRSTNVAVLVCGLYVCIRHYL